MYEGLCYVNDMGCMFTLKEIKITFWANYSCSQIALFRSWMRNSLAQSHATSKCYFKHASTYNFKTSSSCDFVSQYEGKTLYSNIAISYSTRTSQHLVRNDFLPIDQDHYQFVIDTGTTFHVCKSKHLFVDNIKRARDIWIKGVGGKIQVKGYGSIKIRVTDNNSHECDLIINNVLYVPGSRTNLLSPQLWSESCKYKFGTGEMTVGQLTILFWDNHRHTKMLPHHPELKLPIGAVNDGNIIETSLLKENFKQPSIPAALNTSTPLVGYDFNCDHVSEKSSTEMSYPATLNTTMPLVGHNMNGEHKTYIIPLDDDNHTMHKLDLVSNNTLMVDELDTVSKPHMQHKQLMVRKHPIDVIQDDDESTPMDECETVENANDASAVSEITRDESSFTTNQQETSNENNYLDEAAYELVHGMTDDQKLWLRYHYNLKHLPISYMRKLAEHGVIPRKLAKIKPPVCVACLKGKQHRTPWRGRSKDVATIRKPEYNYPGAQTSTDQMISPYGGLIPQMRGRLMKAKYFAATIFVDHYTDYTYVHLQKDTTAESTMEAKRAYEAILLSYGHSVRWYHADNGRYCEPAFTNDVKLKQQHITYCGVGHHSQNGIAESRIKLLSEDARTMLAHGMQLWPQVINKALWPFALKASCRARNKFNLDANGLSPKMKLAGIQVYGEIKNKYPLFCPVYILDR